MLCREGCPGELESLWDRRHPVRFAPPIALLAQPLGHILEWPLQYPFYVVSYAARFAARTAARERLTSLGPFPLIYADPPWKFNVYSGKDAGRELSHSRASAWIGGDPQPR